jgi:hypothetical protein
MAPAPEPTTAAPNDGERSYLACLLGKQTPKQKINGRDDFLLPPHSSM